VTFSPPIGDQFVQQDRRKIYGGNVGCMIPGNVFGFDAQNTVGFQTRTDDIRIDLAETTGRVVRFTMRDDHVIEASGGLFIENRIQWLDTSGRLTYRAPPSQDYASVSPSVRSISNSVRPPHPTVSPNVRRRASIACRAAHHCASLQLPSPKMGYKLAADEGVAYARFALAFGWNYPNKRVDLIKMN
jgi:hypothetical protein